MGGCSRSADITPPPPQTPIPRQRGDRQHKGSDRPQQRHQQLCVHVKVSFSKVARSPGGGIKTESQRRYFEKFKPSVTQNTLFVKMEGEGGGLLTAMNSAPSPTSEPVRNSVLVSQTSSRLTDSYLHLEHQRPNTLCKDIKNNSLLLQQLTCYRPCDLQKQEPFTLLTH